MSRRICSVDGCERPSRRLGWCQGHYDKRRYWGSPYITAGDIRELRFFSHVEIDLTTGCWLWTGGLAKGYSRFKDDDGRHVSAHRWAYLRWVGPVADGLQLDHFKCDTRRCANPAHVRPVTARENTLRSNSITALNLAKTHCVNGHEFTPESTFLIPTGGRDCRPCRRKREAIRRKRKAA